MTRILSQLGLILATLPALAVDLPPGADQTEVYRDFERFSLAHFGAEHQPLTYRFAGKELAFLAESAWRHISVTSASIAWQTTLPSTSFIEYGPTAQLGSKTEADVRPYSVHLSSLRDLKANATYHYRIVAIDERGTRIESPIVTFTTVKPKADVIAIPGDLGDPPYVLDRAGATYLVTEDLIIDGTAFEIKADGITLDLNGHTVVYNQRHWGTMNGTLGGDFWTWVREAHYGIRGLKSGNGTRILNGVIRQGAGNDAAQGNSIGFNPLYFNGVKGYEIAGLTIEYSGAQQVGIYNHWAGADAHIHHNVFIDGGSEVPNRHGAGSRALLLGNAGSKVHNNLVKRTRQSGLQGAEVYNNEVYIDSFATNSFGIALHGGQGEGSKPVGGIAHHNRVYGTGYAVVAFSWTNGSTYHHNFIQLEGQAKSRRSDEWGDQVSLNGFRLTQYRNATHPYVDMLYHDNVIAIRGREGCEARGIQFFSDPNVKNLVFRDNIIQAESMDEQTTQIACIVAQGNPPVAADHQPILYQNNILISNTCHIRLGDYYGTGCNHHFVACELLRTGKRAEYRTVIFDTADPSDRHQFIDCRFEGDAAADSVSFRAPGTRQDYTVSWSRIVQTSAGARLRLVDAEGTCYQALIADTKGQATVIVPDFVITPKGKRIISGLMIEATLNGKTTTQSLDDSGPERPTFRMQL